MKMNYKIKGLNRFIKRVQKKSIQTQKAVDQELARSSLRVEREAKILAPWDTGWMSNNIYSDKISLFTYEVVSPTEYSIYVELGTRYQAAQPFFFIALENEYPKLMKNLKKIVSG